MMHRSIGRLHARAFTMIELLVVIGIILILVGISAPMLTAMSQHRSLEGAVEVTKVEFMQLRERSASTGMPVVAVFEHWTDPVRIVAWSPLYDDVRERWIWTPVSMVRLPERIWAPESWRDEVANLNDASGLPTGLPYPDAIHTLLIEPKKGADEQEYYAFPERENVTEEVDEVAIRRDRKRCYAFVFMPDGTVHTIGRLNVPVTMLQVVPPDTPDGDIILTNGRQNLYMCVNPATARIEWVKADK